MIDRYTKCVLTVIALALVVIASRDVSEKAYAQSGPVHVIVDQFGVSAFLYGPVPVRVQ